MGGLRDVAQACGVSISTVSDILNRGRQSSYRPETIERVLAAVKQVDYHPDRTAQAMRSRRTRVIGFAAANVSANRMENAGVYPFLVGMNRGLTPFGFHVALVELQEMEPEQDKLPPALQERFFDALVVHYGLSERAVRLANRVAMPVLRWDSDVCTMENCLYRDEKAVAHTAMDHLFALGHRRIGYMVGGSRWDRYQAGIRTDHYSFADRYETYATRMLAEGLKPIPLLGYQPEDIGNQIRAAHLTAVVAPEVDGARVAIDAAGEICWRIPRDLTVVALDREARGREIGRKIGGVGYDRLVAGEQAAEIVREILEKGGSVPSCKSLFGEWREGDTVGRVGTDPD